MALLRDKSCTFKVLFLCSISASVFCDSNIILCLHENKISSVSVVVVVRASAINVL